MARAGCGRLVLFAGPPGSGRTALLDRARARATAHRLTVLAAGGEAGERDFPLAVARRLIEPAERYDALLELTRRLAAAAPALVTVDDLHLCDVASLDWLAFVARRLRRHGIALVAGIDARETALIGTLEETGARVLELRPLSERAVATVLRVELGHADFARECHRETGGNPLFVRELARSGMRVSPAVGRNPRSSLAAALAPTRRSSCTAGRPRHAARGGGTGTARARRGGRGRGCPARRGADRARPARDHAAAPLPGVVRGDPAGAAGAHARGGGTRRGAPGCDRAPPPAQHAFRG